jgi:tryptophanase
LYGPSKGDVDLRKLEALIDDVGANRIPYVAIAATVNMAGGQPMSLANLRKVSDLAHANNILVVLDARCDSAASRTRISPAAELPSRLESFSDRSRGRRQS